MEKLPSLKAGPRTMLPTVLALEIRVSDQAKSSEPEVGNGVPTRADASAPPRGTGSNDREDEQWEVVPRPDRTSGKPKKGKLGSRATSAFKLAGNDIDALFWRWDVKLGGPDHSRRSCVF